MAAATVNQKLLFVGSEEGKLLAIRQLIRGGKMTPPALIFVQSKERAQQLFHELVYDGKFIIKNNFKKKYKKNIK